MKDDSGQLRQGFDTSPFAESRTIPYSYFDHFKPHGNKPKYFLDFIEFLERSQTNIQLAGEYCAENGFFKLFMAMKSYYEIYKRTNAKFSLEDIFLSACGSGQIDFVERLLEMSSNLKRKLHRGFQRAAGRGQVKVMEMILDYAGEDAMRILSHHDYASLRAAAFGGKVDAIRFLFDWVGVPLDVIKSSNYQIFRWAAENSQVAVMNFLLDYPGVNSKLMIESADYAAVKSAVRNHRQDIIELLFARSPTIKPVKALLNAIERRNFEIFRVLLEHLNVLEIVEGNNQQVFWYAVDHQFDIGVNLIVKYLPENWLKLFYDGLPRNHPKKYKVGYYLFIKQQ